MRVVAIAMIGLVILVAAGGADQAAPATPGAHAAGTPTVQTGPTPKEPDTHPDKHEPYQPSLVWVLPFVGILLSIAILPLIPATAHWWHSNRHKLIVALVVSGVTCLYYVLRGHGILVEHDGARHLVTPGLPTLAAVLDHAIVQDYVPFIVLLFSLYTISGGIHLEGDLPAHPVTNTAFLAIGAGLASFIGTTGASMLLIRPLLKTNSERKHVTHTVVFFIFLVSNIGGCLLPIGDPPLFLGYLRGVPFLWTFHLAAEWAFVVGILLAVYYVWDSVVYRTEKVRDIRRDETVVRPLRLKGKWNFLWLAGVVFSVALLVPGAKPFGGTWVCPPFLRELAQLMFASCAWVSTSPALRKANKFDFFAITEVACLFIGIFVAMQVPIEILHAVGPRLAEQGLREPWHFFWLTGGLSSFLDNAPTYVVYFETARNLGATPGMEMLALPLGNPIAVPLLAAISLGAVFMGAMTYIGNGPNFMVKSIAERSGVKMPSFFGYMAYSILILVPIFITVTFIFLL